MKKLFLCIAVAIASFSCRDKCVTTGYSLDMTECRAELTDNDLILEADDTVPSADLRLKLFCEFAYHDFDNGLGAYPPAGMTEDCIVVEPGGLAYSTPVSYITVTCDRQIANIEAGEDLLAIIKPSVFVKNEYELSVPEWTDALNRGYFDRYGRETLIVGTPYEFDFAFLPYYVTVDEGDYTFTVTIHFGWDWEDTRHTYTRTFPSVHLK